MLKMSEIKNIVQANMPFDKGFMFMNGARYTEDETKFSITFDGNAVPYIPYTEYEWKSKRWNGKTNPNEGWIRNNTVNDLTLLINTATSREKRLIFSRHTRTAQARERMISQGILESVKGNMNR